MMFFRSAVADPIGPRSFRGVVATTGMKNDGMSLSMSGADLSRAQSQMMPLLLHHDPQAIVGRITAARVSHDRVIIEAEFAPAGVSTRADESCALLKAQCLNCLSAGFDAIQSEPRDPQRPRAGRVVSRWQLLEASLCAVPVDANAVVTARARARFGGYDMDDARADADHRRRQAEMLALVHRPYSADWQKRQRQAEVMRLSPAMRI